MHRRGFALTGALQIPVPPEPMPFNPSHAINARDIFRDPPPPPKPLIERLLEQAQTPERDALLSRLALLNQEVETYIVAAKQDRIGVLESRREEQRARCRELEDEFKTARSELNQAREQIATHSAELNNVRMAQQEAEEWPYDTNYPTPQERAAWAIKRDAARGVRNREEEIHQQLEQAELRLSYRHESAAKALNEAAEKLREIDRELKALQ